MLLATATMASWMGKKLLFRTLMRNLFVAVFQSLAFDGMGESIRIRKPAERLRGRLRLRRRCL